MSETILSGYRPSPPTYPDGVMFVRYVPTAAAMLLFGCSPASPPTASGKAANNPLPTPPPVPTAEASSRTTEVTDACLARPLTKGPIAHLEAKEDEVRICMSLSEYVEPKHSYPCLWIDPDKGSVRSSDPWKSGEQDAAEDPVAAQQVVASSTHLTVCQTPGAQCKRIPVGYSHPPNVGHGGEGGDALIAAKNDAGSLVFVIAAKRVKGVDPSLTTSVEAWGDTFEVATGKRKWRIPLMNAGGPAHVLADPSDIWSAKWIGDRVLLRAHRCCGPDGSEELIDPRSGASLSLGDPALFAPVEPDLWIHGREHEKGGVLSLINVHSATVAAKFVIPNQPLPSPELRAMAMVRRADGMLVVAFTNPAGLVLIDTKSRTMREPWFVPICPDPRAHGR